MSVHRVTRKTQVLATAESLIAEFRRCSNEYARLHIAVAWCGNPKHGAIFKVLRRFGGELTASIGVGFNHTHPDAISWFRSRDADVRIFQDGVLFHPKVYAFTDGHRYAVFVGSSNLTRGGFHENVEVNTLIEGTFGGGKAKDIRALQRALKQWHSEKSSFAPTDKWLAEYRDLYQVAMSTAQHAAVETPPMQDEDAATAGWLQTVDWPTYYRRVLTGLKHRGRVADEYHAVMDAANDALPIPWNVSYFADAENRKIMGGMTRYEWLGHVAASPKLRGFLANGPADKQRVVVRALNRIAGFEHPVPWDALQRELDRLCAVRFTMKVWGRFLCLIRPELYCTVSSPRVRAKLARTLDLTQEAFARPAGYIRLLQMIHAAPWFRSSKPKDPVEAAAWRRRVAFMDPIFY